MTIALSVFENVYIFVQLFPVLYTLHILDNSFCNDFSIRYQYSHEFLWKLG